MSDLERFYAKTKRDPETGCLEWTRYRDVDGYGHFQVGGRSWRSHRWIFSLDHGYLPPEVMHLCDNPGCVELRHLLPGTRDDNMADMVVKGRQRPRRGELHGRARLSDLQVRLIREEYDRGGITQRELGRKYGVGKSQVSNIVRHSQRQIVPTVDGTNPKGHPSGV